MLFHKLMTLINGRNVQFVKYPHKSVLNKKALIYSNNVIDLWEAFIH